MTELSFGEMVVVVVVGVEGVGVGCVDVSGIVDRSVMLAMRLLELLCSKRGTVHVNPARTLSPRITQLCGLCCPEQTTANLADPDISSPVAAVTMQFSHLTGRKKKSVPTKSISSANGSANEIKSSNKCELNSVRVNS